MTPKDLVKRRVEIKHLVPAAAAGEIRRRIASARPSVGVRRPGGWVTTVYFDLPDRRLARAALEQPAANLKLRLREYFDDDGRPCSPLVWFEVKERDGEATRKNRFQIHKRHVGRFLAGELDLGTILVSQGKSQAMEDVVAAVQQIYDLAQSPLAPIGAVRYRRTSVEGGDPAARVTLDERISYHLGPVAFDRAGLGTPTWVEGAAVLEVKHAGERPPDWCRAIVGPAEPAEYSKFLMLARLLLAEVSAA